MTLKKTVLFAFLFVSLCFTGACAAEGEDTPVPEPTLTFTVAPLATATPTGTSIPVPAPTATKQIPQATATPLPQPQSNIPVIVETLEFGLPAGNGFYPRLAAADAKRQRVYLLNSGHSNGDGNTISIFDSATGQFAGRIDLQNHLPHNSNPYAPLALVADSYRPYLYALSGNRYGETEANELFIINTDILTVMDKIPHIRAVTAGPQGLYLIDDFALHLLDPQTKNQLASFPVPAQSNLGPIVLNAHTNRLYLSYGPPWIVDSFNADTLEPAEQFILQSEPLYLMPASDPTRLALVERADSQTVYQTYAVNQAAPLTSQALADDVYGPFPVAHRGNILYWAEREGYDLSLHSLNLLSLKPEALFALPCLPEQLITAPQGSLLYAPCSNPDSVLLAINPTNQTVQTHYSAVIPIDALAVPATDRLYLLKNTGLLDELRLSDHTPLASLQTDYNSLNAGPNGMGKLSLDAPRQRLYLDGPGVQIFNTEPLSLSARLNKPGQLTPDPASDRLYLTPPCKCRFEQCNTLILNAQTLTGTETLFPPAEPLFADCVIATQLDLENQILYTYNYNGVAGSNSGAYYIPFDVANAPRRFDGAGLADISFGRLALDSAHKRVFAPRFRVIEGFLHRFDLDRAADSMQETIELANAFGEPVYSPGRNRLYNIQRFDAPALQVFDPDLSLLSEIPLPDDYSLLAFDDERGHIYLNNEQGQVLIVAVGGGTLQAPPPPDLDGVEPYLQKLYLADNGQLFRIFGGQIYRSDDEGQNWTLLNLGLPAKPVTALAIAPNFSANQTLFAGLGYPDQAGGVYKSQDGGQSWFPATSGLSDMAVAQIAFSPNFSADQTLYLLTTKRGLYRSTDGGQSWRSLAHTYQDEYGSATVSGMALSPNFSADNLLFISRSNLWRSADGGQSWQDTGIPGGAVAFDPGFAQSGLLLSNGRWRSLDGGLSWHPAAAGRYAGYQAVSDLQLSPNFALDKSAYLLYRPDYDSPFTMQRSADGGLSWQSLSPEQVEELDLRAFALHPGGDLYLGHRNGSVSRISPDNLNWLETQTDVTQLDLQALVIAANGSFYVANAERGVFKSDDGGLSWADTRFPAQGEGIDAAMLALSPNNNLFGAVSGALEHSPDGGKSWEHINSLPPGFQIGSLALSPNFANDGLILLGGNYQNNALLRSADGGKSWQAVITAEELDNVAGVAFISFSPNFANDGLVYVWVQYGGLYRSSDSGLNWELVLADSDGQYFAQAMAVSPLNGQVYLATRGGLLAAWQAGEPLRVGLEPAQADGGLRYGAMTFDDKGGLYLGAERDVYFSSDDGRSWRSMGAGLPAEVRAFAWSDDVLYAALAQGGVYVFEPQSQSWRSTAVKAAPAPTATATPAPLALPTATPESPACSQPPALFADVWLSAQTELGCPIPGATFADTLMVSQFFEGGQMYWQAQTSQIYVLPNEKPFAVFPDTWQDDQPQYTCPDSAPSETPPTPQRGFGKVWCENEAIRAALGQAVSLEEPLSGAMQIFEGGLIFEAGERVYVLIDKSAHWNLAERE